MTIARLKWMRPRTAIVRPVPAHESSAQTSPADDANPYAFPLPTREEVAAAGTSLAVHLIALLLLAAMVMPMRALIGAGGGFEAGLGGANGGDEAELFGVPAFGPVDLGGNEVDKLMALGPMFDGAPALQQAAQAGAGAAKAGLGGGGFDLGSALASGGGGGGGKGGGGGGGVGFFGTRQKADSVVFVVDMSGSMTGRRFERAVAELEQSISALEPSQKFFVFFFNGQTHPLFGPRSKPRLIGATTLQRNKAIHWIHSQEAQGHTAPDNAIEQALRLKPQVMFFLTDGEIPDSALETARQFNSDHMTVIHTIAFEYSGSQDLLKEIAQKNKGRFRFVP